MTYWACQAVTGVGLVPVRTKVQKSRQPAADRSRMGWGANTPSGKLAKWVRSANCPQLREFWEATATASSSGTERRISARMVASRAVGA